MQELYNQLRVATNPLEIIELSDKILKKRLGKYIKHMFLKGEMLLSLGRFDEAISIFEQILEYNDDLFTGRAHNSIGFCYSMKNEPKKAESEFEKARQYYNQAPLLLNSTTLNLAAYYLQTKQKEDTFNIFKELYDLNPSNGHEDSHILLLTMSNNPQEFIALSDNTLNESYAVDIEVLRIKGITLIDLKRFNEAIPVFEDIIKYSENKDIIGVAHTYIGYCYLTNNELDKAICEYEKAHEYSDELSMPDKISMLQSLAHIYEMANKNEKALEVLKELSEIDPTNPDIKKKIENLKREINEPDSDEIYNNECLALINLNRFDEAIECYNKALKINPHNVKAWNNKAFALHNLNRLEEAIECYDEALKIDPNFISALQNKAFALRTLNRLKEAIECDEKTLKINPNDFKVWNNKGFCLHELNRSDEAIKCYDKSLKINPNYFEAWANKGFTLENLDRLDEAVECYNKALALSPNNLDMLNRLSFIKAKKNSSVNSLEEALNQADTYWEEKEYEKVIEVYDLISDMPKQPLIWNRKGYSYYQLGRYEQAMKCYDKALEYNPLSAPSMFYKSMIYMDLGDFKNAQHMISLAINIMPDNAEFLNNYCVILNKSGKYDDAILAANDALKIDPESFETYTNKAHALEKLNRFDEALECYDKALKINPNFFEAWYNKTYALENLNRFDEALECYDKALKINPNIYEVWENKANALTSLRRYDEAIECYNKALELSPNNPDILGNMSLCYGIKGDTNKALKCIEDAKKYSGLE